MARSLALSRTLPCALALWAISAGTANAASIKNVKARMPTECQVDETGSAGWLSVPARRDAYSCVAGETNYAAGDNAAAKDYLDWERRDDYPIKSPAHGGHYIAIFANETATQIPIQQVVRGIAEGSAIATPIFAVGADGKVSAGPMLVMEKMKAGFNPDGGDWRYTLTAPDGSIIGDNASGDRGAVNFCRNCSSTFADSVFTALLKGEPPRAPIKPRIMTAMWPPPPQTPVTSSPPPAAAPLAPPQQPVQSLPNLPTKPVTSQSQVLDPNAPVLDPSAPVLDPSAPLATAKAKPKVPAKAKAAAAEKLLEGLKTLQRTEPKT